MWVSLASPLPFSQTGSPCYVSTNMANNLPPGPLVMRSEDFAREALDTVGLSSDVSGCLSHALQVPQCGRWQVVGGDIFWPGGRGVVQRRGEAEEAQHKELTRLLSFPGVHDAFPHAPVASAHSGGKPASDGSLQQTDE